MMEFPMRLLLLRRKDLEGARILIFAGRETLGLEEGAAPTSARAREVALAAEGRILGVPEPVLHLVGAA